ncbi:OmpA family protein [Odoribacter laneus]|uniref:OmpA family protein n=1 Tax=Odoribacter laneus TaxID=626933 RepID=UPI003AB1A13A
MKKIHLFIVTFLLGMNPILAEQYAPYQLKVTDSRLVKENGQLSVEFTIDYSSLEVPANDELIVTPVITKGQDTLSLPFLLFPGKTRDKANQRKMRLYGKEENFPVPYATLYPRGKGQLLFTYRQQLPLEEWMYGGQLELLQNVYGCADCHKILASMPLNYIANPPQVAFIIPVIDQQQKDTLTLYVHFPWDQAVILPDFMNNATALGRMDHSIESILRKQPGKIQRIALTGYASPEGKYTYNARLAGRRANAVKEYILRKHDITGNLIATDTVPEDWQGVRHWVDSSNLKYKKEVVDIIDNTPDPDAKDNRLRRLDKSVTYNRLLQQAYPFLRKVEYRVNYHADPLTSEELKTVYRTHPEKLSPAELYSLCQTYPQGSPEFNEIIFTTVRLYPNNAAANNNAAAVALQQNDMAHAKAYLSQAGNTKETVNNRGVLFQLEGNIPEAIQCFKEACANGCQESIQNLNNLERTQPIQ